MSLRSFLVSCALLVIAAPAAPATQLIRVTPLAKSDLLRLAEIAPEVRDCGAHAAGGAIEFAAEEGRAEELRAAGFAVDVTVSDLEAYYASRLDLSRGGGEFGLYHTWGEAIADMDALQAQYPALMTPKQQIGTTIEGRPIWVYKLSDNPGVDEDEPEIFFNAYIHAREAITFEVLYALAQQLLTNYDNGAPSPSRETQILNSREIWIEPCVNPDGVEYNRATDPNGGGMWRKNRRVIGANRGVDLNRNFGYMWGIDNVGSSNDPSSDTYRGSAAFSEPETQAIRDFVNTRHFSISLNYHSYSNLHIFSYGYDNIHSPDYEALLALGQVRRETNGYDTGNPWELLYRVNGESCDWMYGDTSQHSRIFAYVTEVGTLDDGFWPLESRIPTLVAENMEANLKACELADDPYRALRPTAGQVSSPDTVGTTFTLTFSNPGADPSNPAAAWNLLECTGHNPAGTDDVEGTKPSRWLANGWATSTTRSHSSTHSWWGGQADHLNNTLTSLRAHKVVAGEQLSYWTWYNIESGYDYGYVEISTNGRTFTTLAGNFTTNSDPNGQNLGNGITGNSNGWKNATHSLAAYVGQTVWIRFRYNTDGGWNEAGWYVDDVTPADLFATETVGGSNLPSAQKTYNLHTLGTFYYIVQPVDAEGQAGVYGIAKKVEVMQTTAAPEPVAVAWEGLSLLSANPILGTARMRFAVPADARDGAPLRLSVYDVGGREVAELMAGRVGTSGLLPGAPVSARWEPRGNAGIYFARLTVGDRASEERLVVLN